MTQHNLLKCVDLAHVQSHFLPVNAPQRRKHK